MISWFDEKRIVRDPRTVYIEHWWIGLAKRAFYDE